MSGPDESTWSGAPPGQSDRELVAKTAQGDHRAYESLVRNNTSLVFGRALAIVRHRQTAEDVTQAVFSKVWTKASTFDVERGSVQAWLNILVRSTSIDAVRGEERHKRRKQAAIKGVSRNTNDVEETVVLHERGEAVRSALAQLKGEQREAIELAYFGGLTYRQVAEQLGVPEGTIKARIRRGMIQLSRLLEEGMGTP